MVFFSNNIEFLIIIPNNFVYHVSYKKFMGIQQLHSKFTYSHFIITSDFSDFFTRNKLFHT